MPKTGPYFIDSGMDITDNDFPEKLAQCRRRIDELDDRIIELFKERIGIVGEVGALKRRHFPDRCPIRSAREAEVVLRIMDKFKDSAFIPAAAGMMWRTLIGASTTTEIPLSLSVFTGEGNDAYWLAREYFGLFIPTVTHPQVKRVIGDVMDGKANIGIVPCLRKSDDAPWWTSLTGEDSPKIFARLPYIYHGAPPRNAPACLAIARLKPEASGNDSSIHVIEADSSVSQHKLQSALASAGLETQWIGIAPLSPSSRHHLVEIKGFHEQDDPGLRIASDDVGAGWLHTYFLGAYALPVILETDRPHMPTPHNKAISHAKP